MGNVGILERGRAALIALMVALAMLSATLPVSADRGRGGGGHAPTNITWEASINISWE